MDQETFRKDRVSGREAYASACLLLKDNGSSREAASREAMELLAYCCYKEKLKLLLDLDEPLDPVIAEHYGELARRLADHEPIAYLTGNVVFGGREYFIAPGVLIPRDDTMTLVRQALARLDLHESCRIVELGCGSGAVIATLALERPNTQCYATDIDALAIKVTKKNLCRHDITDRAQVYQGDWFEPLNKQDKFHMILSNPPYISASEMAELPESVKKEPETALRGGEDGLDCYRQVLPSAFDRLEYNGWCLMEIGWKQGQAVKTLFESTGFCDVSIYPDEAGRDRVVAGRKVKEADKLPGQEYGKPASASADDELCTVDAETDASEADVSARTTQHWRIYDAGDPRIAEAGRMIREGRLVAFPTETVYGLGANGLDEKAVAGIYEAKSRPADNPLILHVASVEDAKALTTEWGDKAARLADKLWPGPLTIVLPAAAHIPDIVTAGLDTIAIRYPSDPIALALIEAAGVPVAAPSANASGRPSPTRAEHVLEDMAGRIDVVLDNGPCKVGLESTILDLSVELPAVLRPGDITIEALRRIIGEVRAGEDQGANTDYRDGERGIAPKAPGMKYRHYAPRAPVAVLQGEYQAVARYVEESLLMQTVTSKDGAVRQKTGLLLSEETWLILAGKGIQPEDQEAYYCRDMGSHDRPREMGTLLYEALRACDREGTDRIYVEACSPEGQGAAVLNRLRKAAGSSFIQVV